MTTSVASAASASAASVRLTAEQFAARPPTADGSREELAAGRIVTMPPPGFRHGEIQSLLVIRLGNFVLSQRLGRITTETGVATEREPDTVRGPDVAFWSRERLPANQHPIGYPSVSPDLVAEVLSPDDRWSRITAKVGEYLNAGVRLVWVVDPDNRRVTVFRPDQPVRVLAESETLTGEEVLPGFATPISELFAE